MHQTAVDSYEQSFPIIFMSYLSPSRPSIAAVSLSSVYSSFSSMHNVHVAVNFLAFLLVSPHPQL